MDEAWKELNDLSKRVALLESQFPFEVKDVGGTVNEDGELGFRIGDTVYFPQKLGSDKAFVAHNPKYSENDLRELFGKPCLPGEHYNSKRWSPSRFLNVIKNQIIADADAPW